MTGSRVIFTQMFARMREALGSGGDVILQQLGIATGQSVAQDRLRSLGRKVVLKHELQLVDEMMAQGWEDSKVISLSSNSTRAAFRLHESFECAWVRAEPNSQFVKGCRGLCPSHVCDPNQLCRGHVRVL